MLAGDITLTSPLTVSYTHLDVYKRQDQGRGPARWLGKGDVAQAVHNEHRDDRRRQVCAQVEDDAGGSTAPAKE